MTIYLKTNLYYGPIRKHYLYRTWQNIKARCFNPKCKAYKNYGAIGIGMFHEWINNSVTFLEWIDNTLGKRPDGFSLDRIDPFGGYFPDNLRWASLSIQAKNIRNPKEKARKHSESLKGKKHSSESKQKMSDAHKGKPSGMEGKKHSSESKQKISEAKKGKKQKTKQCPHCGKVCGVSNYSRYHGLNCPKLKETTEQLWNAWYSEFITTQEKEKVS